jgi:hypothetical protein
MKHIKVIGICQLCSQPVRTNMGTKEHVMGNASKLRLHLYKEKDELDAA